MKNIHERVANLDRLIERERRPYHREHYINVLRELEESMRSKMEG